MLLLAANSSSTASDGALMKSVAIGQSLVGGSRVKKPRLTALIGGAQVNHASPIMAQDSNCLSSNAIPMKPRKDPTSPPRLYRPKQMSSERPLWLMGGANYASTLIPIITSDSKLLLLDNASSYLTKSKNHTTPSHLQSQA